MTLCSRRPTAVRLSTSSASHSTAPADSDPFLSPSPLASLARSPLEAKCRSIRSSLPRTIVLPSAATIVHRGLLSLRPRRTGDAHVRLLGDGAESLPCRPKPIPFLPEVLSAINRHLGTPEPGPSPQLPQRHAFADHDGAPFDVIRLISTLPVNPGAPLSGTPAPSAGLRRRSADACR